MKIIVRAGGERTEPECIRRVKQYGEPIVIRKRPFGEAVRETMRVGSKLDQKWVPVIDADVLLKGNKIKEAIKYLEKKDKKKNVFCLDGRTKDKIMCRVRRAGVHIYRRKHMEEALKYVDDTHIKPESNMRRKMEKKGYKTVAPSDIVFGYHDYEQYYRDLWRKSFVQTRKLKGMIKNINITKKWIKKKKTDKDYRVILEAHRMGRRYKGDVIIDVDMDFNSKAAIKLMGLKEKASIENI